MSLNRFGRLFRVTTWGESHGAAIGCVLDGVPPRLALDESDIQPYLDKRRPGRSRFVTQRKESDTVAILSGTFEGLTTGTPIALEIQNEDARSGDYDKNRDKFRPGHADYTYQVKYGIRDHRGGGRQSARETAMRVAAGAVARKILGPDIAIRGALVSLGEKEVDRARWDWAATKGNDFWCPDSEAVADWEAYLDEVRKAGSSVGAVIEIEAAGVPVIMHCGHDLGPKTAAMLHVAAACPSYCLANDSTYFGLEDDIIKERFVITNGRIPVPTTPGLGLEGDPEKLDRYKIDC